MKHSALTEDQFLKDVAGHQMKVIRDDDVNRHIRFKEPGSSSYWFDIITYSGALVIDGDCGTYVFRRLHDMFEFFRTDREHFERKGHKLAINPGYWSEKLQAMPARGIKEFDEDKFDAEIMERLTEWVRCHREDTDKEERRELWEAVVNEVIHADGGERKRMAAYDFHHTVHKGLEFCFQDFWETNVERYTNGFLWNCYAIAYAVKAYDDSKAQAAAPAEAVPA